jgi:hypothetical protein
LSLATRNILQLSEAKNSDIFILIAHVDKVKKLKDAQGFFAIPDFKEAFPKNYE